jgi:site-specific recombinase XerC
LRASSGRREFRTVTRAHLIAWRDELRQRALGGATIRHRLASLSSLFEYLCEKNAVTHNPVKGVERPRTESGEGKTPAIGDHRARDLLAAPDADTVKSKRDRAVRRRSLSGVRLPRRGMGKAVRRVKAQAQNHVTGDACP